MGSPLSESVGYSYVLNITHFFLIGVFAVVLEHIQTITTIPIHDNTTTVYLGSMIQLAFGFRTDAWGTNLPNAGTLVAIDSWPLIRIPLPV